MTRAGSELSTLRSSPLPSLALTDVQAGQGSSTANQQPPQGSLPQASRGLSPRLKVARSLTGVNYTQHKIHCSNPFSMSGSGAPPPSISIEFHLLRLKLGPVKHSLAIPPFPARGPLRPAPRPCESDSSGTSQTWPQPALPSVSAFFHKHRALKVHPCGGGCQSSFLFKEERFPVSVRLSVCHVLVCPSISGHLGASNLFHGCA